MHNKLPKTQAFTHLFITVTTNSTPTPLADPPGIAIRRVCLFVGWLVGLLMYLLVCSLLCSFISWHPATDCNSNGGQA